MHEYNACFCIHKYLYTGLFRKSAGTHYRIDSDIRGVKMFSESNSEKMSLRNSRKKLMTFFCFFTKYFVYYPLFITHFLFPY